jgi:transcriptional regulator with XRE-family HTH domain
MPQQPPAPGELGRLLRDRRQRGGLSLRQAAKEVGVSFNTLARIEKGHMPDVETFQRVAEWLGVAPADVLRPSRRRGASTPDIIASHLTADPALTEEAAARIGGIVSELYSALAKRTTTAAVHLRSARSLRMDAAIRLADLVAQMHDVLERENASR